MSSDHTIKSKIDLLSSLQKQVQALEQEIQSSIDLQPVREDLVFYFGEGCPYTKKALPEVSCLERFLQQPLIRKETWHNEVNHEAWKEHGGITKCGGVPYFFNKTTGESICGAASCEKLQAWAIIATKKQGDGNRE